MIKSVLDEFGEGWVGLERDELASMDAQDRELLLRKLLACQIAPNEQQQQRRESGGVGQYICANLDPDGVQHMHEHSRGEVWNFGKDVLLKPEFYQHVFDHAVVNVPDENGVPFLKQNESYIQFKERLGEKNDNVALKLFHTLHLPNLRDIVLHTVGNDIVKANALHEKLLYYKKEVEGPHRTVIKEDLNDLLTRDIAFKPELFVDAAASAAAIGEPVEAAAAEEKTTIPLVVVAVKSPWNDEQEHTLRIALKSYYKMARLPLNFPARIAAKQIVLLSRSDEVPDNVLGSILHRDQDLSTLRQTFAEHPSNKEMFEHAMEPIASNIDEKHIKDNVMCLHFYNNTMSKAEQKKTYTPNQFLSKFFIENEQPVGKFWIKKVAEIKV
jgi:hypothetical protein